MAWNDLTLTSFWIEVYMSLVRFVIVLNSNLIRYNDENYRQFSRMNMLHCISLHSFMSGSSFHFFQKIRFLWHPSAGNNWDFFLFRTESRYCIPATKKNLRKLFEKVNPKINFECTCHSTTAANLEMLHVFSGRESRLHLKNSHSRMWPQFECCFYLLVKLLEHL